jgi:hypothetical protein
MEQTMNTTIDEIHKTFKISNIRSAIMGGTIMNQDISMGSPAGSGNSLDCIQYLNLFPELADLERSEGNAFEFMGLSTLWNVGFVSILDKLTTPDFFGGQASKYLKNRKIKTVDQLFSRRSESTVGTFFRTFKLNGADSPIIKPEYSTQTDFDEFKRYGLVIEQWIDTPPTIHYAVSVNGNNTTRDYLYLIGGDENTVIAKPNEIVNHLSDMYKKIKELFKNTPITKSSRDVLNSFENICASNNIWCEVGNISDQARGHILIEKAKLIKEYTRIIHATISIYSYLLHTKKHLQIDNIYKVSDGKLEEQVKIETLLDQYHEPYIFCRNMILFNNDFTRKL